VCDDDAGAATERRENGPRALTLFDDGDLGAHLLLFQDMYAARWTMTTNIKRAQKAAHTNGNTLWSCYALEHYAYYLVCARAVIQFFNHFKIINHRHQIF